MRHVLLLVMVFLAGCALDREAAVRRTLSPYLYLLETEHFESRGACTAAVFHLALPEFRASYPVALDLNDALEMIRRNVAVHLDFEGLSVHQISAAIMSADLARGLGLMSAGIEPAKNCMSPRILRGYTRALVLSETELVYMPQSNAILLLYPPEQLAFFLRSNL